MYSAGNADVVCRDGTINAGLTRNSEYLKTRICARELGRCLGFPNGLVSGRYLRAHERKIRLACGDRVIAVNLGWSA